MIGISFYLNDPLAEERIEDAGKKGVDKAFTSLHIPEESGNLAARAKKLLQVAKNVGIEVYADVSYKTPHHLGIAGFEDLLEFGVSGLRLDDFFDYEEIITLSKSFKIALNASILFEKDLQQLLNAGLDKERLIAWHNFYPRPETGLEESFFYQQNQLYNKYNIPISAYVPGRGEKRGPLFAGLPTLEKHREVDPFQGALELYDYGIHDVYIGDPDPGEGLIEELIQYDKNHAVSLRIESSFLNSEIYQLRPDFSRDVLRFMNTRSTSSIPPSNTIERPRGTITMDNDLYGRYKGEIQITLRNLPADERVNVLGHVVEQDLPLLSLVKPGDRVYMKLYN
ncbi:MupG family TIM beta-alpha barrel fold protein [Bacillus sp. 03113]|uniref:MupG family TIM beta-alpha barrel fold protein n=1 Tax=Bacillus sp. 03113 TaxID=2578211 RepID=UPI00114465AC|nr:MupG family TIM beta-alpha barrel fold protein [Bacillus sp. 03113]